MPISTMKTISGGYEQAFENGRIYHSTTVGAYSMSGGIKWYYDNQSAGLSEFGFPVTEETCLGGNLYVQHYKHGSIYWNNGVVSVIKFPQ